MAVPTGTPTLVLDSFSWNIEGFFGALFAKPLLSDAAAFGQLWSRRSFHLGTSDLLG